MSAQKKTYKKRKKKIKISYNAPVSLTFSLICTAILLLNGVLENLLIPALFTVPGSQGSIYPFNMHNPLHYFQLFSHVFGHADWGHLLGNLSFILLLGPLLEERYGPALLSIMIATTAFVTGVINAAFMPTPLIGASGVAFMMILLASFNTLDKKSIPITFILILVLYLGRELLESNQNDSIANWAHILGGVIGSVFGFLAAPVKRKRKPKPPTTLPKEKEDADKTVVL